MRFLSRMRLVGAFGLLLSLAASLATWLEPWFQQWAGSRTGSANVMAVALGDGRRLFARQFFAKADVYFHGGYYPSIYDSAPVKLHLAAQAGAETHDATRINALGPPKDWIDRFSRHFYPSVHRHLGEREHGRETNGAEPELAHAEGEEREILPWLRVASMLDPEMPDTYIVASYWMRSRLGMTNEAEHFLREGLRANPGHPEMLLELGRIYAEDRKDPARARNVWELAVRKCREKPAMADTELFVYARTLGQLARLEQEQQRYSQAIAHLEVLRTLSPNTEALDRWIEELKRRR